LIDFKFMAPSSNPPVDISTAQKVLLCAVCSLAITSVSLAFKKAEADGISFNPIAATFFSEIFKALIALVLAIKSGKSFSQIRLSPIRQTSVFLVPAFLYVLINNLRYFIFQLVDPGLLGVMWNLKIVVVGILYQCPPFNRLLLGRQWLGILLLVSGSALADLSQWSVSTEDGGSNTGGLLGLTLLMIGVVLASASAVSCEYAYKSTAEYMDFPAQCLVLYTIGAVLNFTAFLINESSHGFYSNSEHATKEPFPYSLVAGFNGWAWFAVVDITIVGFLIGLIFKYIDSIAQVLPHFLFSIAHTTLFHLHTVFPPYFI
jgi:hypothetical protein